jgi:hypothetical protein
MLFIPLLLFIWLGVKVEGLLAWDRWWCKTERALISSPSGALVRFRVGLWILRVH